MSKVISSSSTGSASPSGHGVAARLPVLTAFVAMAVLTAMAVVAGTEREAPPRAPVAAPGESTLELQESDLTPMAGLIPWALPVRPNGPDAPLGDPAHPSNPSLPTSPGDDSGVYVDLGKEPRKDQGGGSPERPGSSDPAEPDDDAQNDGQPAGPSGGPSSGGPSDDGPSEGDPSGGPSDGGSSGGPSDGGPSGGPSDGGPSGGPDEGGSSGGPADVGPEVAPATSESAHDLGVGGISHTSDETGVSNLSVPTTASSGSALTGTVAAVSLTLRSTGPADPALPDGARAPVTVKSAGGDGWTCRGPGGDVLAEGESHTFSSGATLTCRYTYSSESPAPTLGLRVVAVGLQGNASISAVGNVDPNTANDAGSF